VKRKGERGEVKGNREREKGERGLKEWRRGDLTYKAKKKIERQIGNNRAQNRTARV